MAKKQHSASFELACDLYDKFGFNTVIFEDPLARYLRQYSEAWVNVYDRGEIGVAWGSREEAAFDSRPTSPIRPIYRIRVRRK